MKTFKFTQGFTLLEILIALVVFSIGLLGLTGLQIMSLKLNHDSLLRSTATLLAKDMADRIRANVNQASLGIASEYNNAAGNATAFPNCLSKDVEGNILNVSCSNAAMAQHDFYEWNSQISGADATAWHPEVVGLLPNGRGVVCIDSTPNDGTPPPGDPLCDNIAPLADRNVYTIKVWWDERKDADTTPDRRFVMSISL